MLKIKRRKHVYTIIPNKNGFTLVSLLLSLAILSSTLVLIPAIYRLVEEKPNTDELSVRQFFHFLTDEVHENKFDYTTSNSIYLKNESGESVTISSYLKIIRRQINGKGHEILVRNITAFMVQELPYGLRITITIITGDIYEKTISFH